MTWQQELTQCKQGHAYDESNTYVSPRGWRTCKTCRRNGIANKWRREHPMPKKRKLKQVPLAMRTKASSAEHKRRRKERARAFVAMLKDRPCTDCGGRFHHCAMDFDHLDDDAPKRSMSCLMEKGRSDRVLLEEAAKCEVVCSNCHRVRTFTRRRTKAGVPLTTPTYPTYPEGRPFTPRSHGSLQTLDSFIQFLLNFHSISNRYG